MHAYMTGWPVLGAAGSVIACHIDCAFSHAVAAFALQGYLSVNYSDNYYLLSQRHAAVPRLTSLHYEAMSLFTKLASSEELRMDYLLQPGEIQLLNNHTQLHSRSEFVDFDDIDHRRHLLR